MLRIVYKDVYLQRRSWNFKIRNENFYNVKVPRRAREFRNTPKVNLHAAECFRRGTFLFSAPRVGRRSLTNSNRDDFLKNTFEYVHQLLRWPGKGSGLKQLKLPKLHADADVIATRESICQCAFGFFPHNAQWVVHLLLFHSLFTFLSSFAQIFRQPLQRSSCSSQL